MSVHMHSLVYGRLVGSPTLKAVLLKLADVANEDGASIYPSVARIAAETEFSERAVRTAMASLRDSGLISVVREGGGVRPTEYRMNVPAVRALPLAFRTPAPPAPPAPDAPPAVGAAPASDAPDPCTSSRGGVQDVQGRGAGAAPITVLEQSMNSPTPSARAWFVEFMGAYPKPSDEEASWAEFQRAVEKGTPAELLVQIAVEVGRTVERGEIELRYVPKSANFLRKGEYLTYAKLLAQQDRVHAQNVALCAGLENWTERVDIDPIKRRQWFAGVRFEGMRGEVAMLMAPTKTQRDYLQHNLNQQLRAAFSAKQVEVGLFA